MMLGIDRHRFALASAGRITLYDRLEVLTDGPERTAAFGEAERLAVALMRVSRQDAP